MKAQQTWMKQAAVKMEQNYRPLASKKFIYPKVVELDKPVRKQSSI